MGTGCKGNCRQKGGGAGVQAGPFADLIHAKAVEIIPEGEESLWNIDGELHTGSIKAQVHRGLIDVFSRGIESMEPA